ncbi:MAG: hypothetical protein WCP79_13735 [Bacillota bacterium]
MKRTFVAITLIFVLLSSLTALAQEPNQLSVLQADISNFVAKLAANNKDIENTDAQLHSRESDFASLKAQLSTAITDTDIAQTKYDRAYYNPDMFTDEVNNQLRHSLIAAKDKVNQIKNSISNARTEIAKLNSLILTLRAQNSEYRKHIQNAQAEMFDIQFKSPTWVEGYGESIMDENASVKSCRQLARLNAMRDATEKAGAMLISSTTVVQMNQVVKDEIKAKSQVQVLSEDVSESYGKAQQVSYGEYGKFVCKVRIQIQNTSSYNPYRE